MRLREWREAEGLTQAQLAAELQIHSQYLSDIERGVRVPGSRLAVRIRRRTSFKVSLSELLSGADRKAA